MTRLLLHSAIHWEAAAIIKHYGLKKDLSFKSLEVFSNDEITYVISGIGKLKAACAVSRVLQTFKDPSKVALINIGVAGSKPKEYEVGTLLRIVSCKDLASGRSYYPELTLNFDIPEASIETHDKPVTSDKISELSSSLVDMELAGALEAASHFITWDRVYSFKIVSDLLEVGCLSKKFVEDLVDKNLEAILKAIKQIQLYLESSPSILDIESVNFVDQVADKIRLTSSQRAKLQETIKGAEVKGLEWKGQLEPYLKSKPQNKKEVSMLLDEVCRAISVS